jgi:hypothetical protein
LTTAILALRQHQPASTSLTANKPSKLHALQTHFLAIMPRIRVHAEIHLGHIKCPGRRADAIAEVIALSWSWYVRAIEHGKDPSEFVSALADFAVKHVRCGRRLCGQEKAKDVMSPRAQRNKGFTVEPLPNSTTRSHEEFFASPHGQERMDAVEERLRDNTQSPIPDQAAFRIDYPAWLKQLERRKRKIVKDMVLDIGTMELAAKHKLSPGRISQMRREFRLDWHRFHGEEA